MSGQNSPIWKGGPVEVKCQYCGKVKKVNRAYALVFKHCSYRCYGKAQKQSSRGSNNPNWKGGIHPLGLAIRGSDEYSEWRTRVFKRDNFKCQDCGQSGGNLQAHHKKAFFFIFQEFLAKYNRFSPIEEKDILLRLSFSYSDFWNVKNGQTLCEDCHSNLTTRPDANTMLHTQGSPASITN